jgi:hypothetical protein
LNLPERVSGYLSDWLKAKAARERVEAVMTVLNIRRSWPFYAENSLVKHEELVAAIDAAAWEVLK